MKLHAEATIAHIANGLQRKGEHDNLIEIVVKGRISLVAQEERREVQAGRDLHLLFYHEGSHTVVWSQVREDEPYQPESLPGAYGKVAYHASGWRASIGEALVAFQSAIFWALDEKFKREFRREPGPREAASLAYKGDDYGLELWIVETRIWHIAHSSPDWTKQDTAEFHLVETEGSRTLDARGIPDETAR